MSINDLGFWRGKGTKRDYADRARNNKKGADPSEPPLRLLLYKSLIGYEKQSIIINTGINDSALHLIDAYNLDAL